MSLYSRAEDALHGLARLPIDNTPPRSGHRFRKLLDERGRPDASIQLVVVAGTCGKGSTAACIAALLRACGESVGLFTGPHLARYTERVVVDGRAIGSGEWARRVMALLQFARRFEERPSVLEVLAAVALEHFSDRGVRWGVMEAGVGGQRDYTMGVDPDISVLTRVDLDHTHILGATLEEIAEEKCGVIRAGTSVVSAPQFPAVNNVILRRARDVGAHLWLGGRDFSFECVRCTPRRTRFDFASEPLHVDWRDACVPLAGAHQAENAATALAAVLRAWTHGRLLFTEDKARRGLGAAGLAGRLEMFVGRPDVLLDGAHQPAGARALREALETIYKGRRVFLVLGVLEDKDRDAVASLLVPRATATWLTLPPWTERAGDAETLEAWAATARSRSADARADTRCPDVRLPLVRAEPDWRAAFDSACLDATTVSDSLVCVTGSLYLVGALRLNLRKRQIS